MRDVRLGVIERIPLNTPVTWQSSIHITAKHDRSPCRTIDYQAVNDSSPRQTYHTHSEEDRNITTFISEWGNFRYKTCPQGFLSAGDAYTNRRDRLLQDMERQRRCVDDTLL